MAQLANCVRDCKRKVWFHLHLKECHVNEKLLVFRDDFSAFAETCFKEFGDRVKHWITFNEPSGFVLLGYNSGSFPPKRCSKHVGACISGDSGTEPYIAGHNVLLSHATTVDMYRKRYQVFLKVRFCACIWVLFQSLIIIALHSFMLFYNVINRLSKEAQLALPLIQLGMFP